MLKRTGLNNVLLSLTMSTAVAMTSDDMYMILFQVPDAFTRFIPGIDTQWFVTVVPEEMLVWSL